MVLILAYIFVIILGGVAMWIIAKLFSADPPHLIQCFVGAGIAEFVSIFNIPVIPFIVLYVMLIKMADFDGISAFVATMLYVIIKLLLFGIILGILSEIF